MWCVIYLSAPTRIVEISLSLRFLNISAVISFCSKFWQVCELQKFDWAFVLKRSISTLKKSLTALLWFWTSIVSPSASNFVMNFFSCAAISWYIQVQFLYKQQSKMSYGKQYLKEWTGKGVMDRQPTKKNEEKRKKEKELNLLVLHDFVIWLKSQFLLPSLWRHGCASK